MWFRGGEDFPCLQVIWPDHEQRYPWESGFRANLVRAQPLLDHEDAAEARALGLLASMSDHHGA